jgi:hypothetical protein
MERYGIEQSYLFLILWARFLLLMRFLRHFQRMLPFFFHTLELRFIETPQQPTTVRQTASPS